MQQTRRQQLTADLWAKAGELEKQFASFKKKVERSDQAKDESTHSEKKDGGRGEFHERYMRIRDAKLREQLSFRMERKRAEMTAMWERLEKSQAEMAVRLGGTGKVEPIRIPSPAVSKKTVQLKKEPSDEKKGRDVTPRNTNSNTKRYSTPLQTGTSSSSQSSTTHASALPQSPKRTSAFSTNGTRSLPRLKSPARSAAIFSDLRKENKTPATPRTRVLTKSQNLVFEKNNARVPPKKPPQAVDVISRTNGSTGTIKPNDDEQTALEENMKPGIDTTFEPAIEETAQAGIDTMLEPVITIEDNILQDTLTEIVLNQKIEEELTKMQSSSSYEMLDHVEPNNKNNDNNDNGDIFVHDIANCSQNAITNVNSILIPGIDDEGESSGGSSRSWCSNLETFSRSTIDPMIDSPILSPCGSGSSSFRFIPEPTTIRVRKKWESRSINSPRGIKRFLSFGKKNKGIDILADGMISTPAGFSIITDDESDNASNEINQMSLVSYESKLSRNGTKLDDGDQTAIGQAAHALTGSLAASGAKYDQKEDGLSVHTQKSHRSFFGFSPFLFKGAESKIRSQN